MKLASGCAYGKLYESINFTWPKRLKYCIKALINFRFSAPLDLERL